MSSSNDEALATSSTTSIALTTVSAITQQYLPKVAGSLSSITSPQLFLPHAKESSSSISVVTATLWFVLCIFFKIMNYVVVIVPTILINSLSVNYQITLSLSSILLTLSGVVAVCFVIVRYKYLTGYSKSTKPKETSKLKNKDISLVGDMSNKKKRGDNRSTSNYLDEFLSAIKVFGYLERPVFHELTKNMTTQKLSMDELLYLDENLGFSIVVEGTIQVYTKVNKAINGGEYTDNYNLDEDDDEGDDNDDYEKDDSIMIGNQRYQLLNEVKSGSPLSSLMSTLDLFKPYYSKPPKNMNNDFKSSTSAVGGGINTDQLNSFNLSQTSNNGTKAIFNLNTGGNEDSSGISPLDSIHTPFPTSSTSTPFRDNGLNDVDEYESYPTTPQPTGKDQNTLPSHQSAPQYLPKADDTIYPDIIARPKPPVKTKSHTKSGTSGTQRSNSSSLGSKSATIAIIPYSAFQRVQAKYPKATSHIVTMVLTRLYKVTMNTVHNYLGLTRELIDSEIKLNSLSVDTNLPSYLHEGIIERFYGNAKESESKSGEFKEKSLPSSIMKSNHNESQHRNKQTRLGKKHPSVAKLHPRNLARQSSSSRYVVLDSRSKSSHPGDLLSSVPLSRRSDYYQTHATSVQTEACDDSANDKSSTVLPSQPESAKSNMSNIKSDTNAKIGSNSNININEKNSSSSSTLKNLSSPKLNREFSKIEDIRDRAFSDEREETEETSLRIAIVENMFKLMGIDESQTMIDESTLRSGSSGFSSANSSIIGLSSLVNNDANYSNSDTNPYSTKFEHNIYDSASGRVKMDYFNSFNNSRSSSPVPGKVYNTISQSHLKGYRANDADSMNQYINQNNQNQINSPFNNTINGRKSTSNQSADISFHNVKDDFGKYIEIKYVPPNTTIVEQGSFNSGLYYVIHGTLDVIYRTSRKDPDASRVPHQRKLYTVQPGGLAGYLCSVVGFRSLVSIKASKDKGAIIAHISKHDFSKLMDKFYFLQLPVASKLKTLLSKQILTIDYALEWVHIPAGNVLCSQGDLANGFHIVLSGRFRVIKYDNPRKSEVHLDNSDADVHDYNDNLIDESTNKKHSSKHSKISNENFTILGEYGHGESIGEVEVLTASRRTNSLVAVRDSETARIPRTLFEMLSLQNPSIMVKVSRIVASRGIQLAGINNNQLMNSSISPIPTTTTPYISNEYKTITILPTVSGLPVREFADKLVHALKTIGRNVIALDQASTLTHLGRHAFDERLSQLKLSGYFAYLEEEYETIVYVCDTALKSNWTSTCISQGDCILLLADADDDDVAVNVGEYERLLVKLKTTARTDLCLIHSDKYVVPGSTSVWMKNRIWVQGHHHIQMEINSDKNEEQNKKKLNIISGLAAKISSKTNPNIKLKLENVKSKAISSLHKLNTRLNRADKIAYKSVQSHKNDFLRLARILSNEAVGLVLGGGGSRGISHVGVVMALEKHGIPVDLIGGTSIGSFVGGLYALDYNTVAIYGRAKKFAKRVSSVWRSLFDLTYPVTSYITGYEFNRGIWKLFGFNEIEDFWIKYFCNSTNITNSTMDIHETGYAWRFIRASMSLAGLLPPITFNGSMLLDGGYLDNLPVMEMKKKGAKYIIAVDVGSVDDRTPMNYGDTLSGFWVLFNRWNPFSKYPNVPNMMDIQLRLAYVASVNALELAKKTPGVIYLRPPIDDYATLDFAKFDEIHHVGLAYADNLFTKWEKNGKLPPIAGMVDKTNFKIGDVQTSLYRRNSI